MNTHHKTPTNPWHLFIWVFIFSVSATAETLIVYPKPFTPQDHRQSYPIELLTLALAKTDKDYRLVSSQASMHQMRALKSMETSQGIDVVWTMTAKEREQRLNPIRIPIHKGLIGWRIPLIRQSDISVFDSLKTRQQIQALRAGQGHDWPDAAILRHNHFQTISAPSYTGLFKMLAAGRLDYFPRSIVEVWSEADSHEGMNLAVDQNFLITYPAATYFFVRKSATELAADIEQGLEASISSGEFDQLFNHYHGKLIERSNLTERTSFTLDNPFLPKETPLSRQELWFRLSP